MPATPSATAGGRDSRRRQSMPLLRSSTPSAPADIERVAPFAFAAPPMPEPDRERGLAARAFAAILSRKLRLTTGLTPAFRRRPAEHFQTTHIVRSTPAFQRARCAATLTQGPDTPLDTWHSWSSELSIASKLADESRHLSPSSAGQRHLRRSLSGTLVRRVRTPSVVAPQAAIEAMLGRPGAGASQASLRSTAPTPQIALDFDWGPSASELPSDALCTPLDEPEQADPPASFSTSTGVRPRGTSTSSGATSVGTAPKSKPRLRRLGSRRFSRSAKYLPVAATPLPRIQLELIEDGFSVDFSPVNEGSAERQVPGAWT